MKQNIISILLILGLSLNYSFASVNEISKDEHISNNNMNYKDKNYDLYMLHKFGLAYINSNNTDTSNFQDLKVKLESIKKEIETMDKLSVAYKTMKMLELAEDISKNAQDIEDIKNYIQKNIIETIELALKESIINQDPNITVETDKSIIYFFRIYSQIQLEINVLINELNLKEDAISASKISIEDLNKIKEFRMEIISNKEKGSIK